eukprot:4897294-Ditylum_brightwellii.AAC.1
MDQIKAIENQFSGVDKKINNKDKIALVLEKASKDDAGILATTVKEKGSAVTMDDLKEAIQIQYSTYSTRVEFY